MNKKLQKGLTATMAAAMAMGVAVPATTVLAAPVKVTNGWSRDAATGKWYFYRNSTMVKNAWAQDSTGWCYLTADGSWLSGSAWEKDSHGWCYIQNGYWVVNHAMYAKDSAGWQFVGTNGYWDSSVAPVAANPLTTAIAAVVAAETNKTAASITAATTAVNALNNAIPEKTGLNQRIQAIAVTVSSVSAINATNVAYGTAVANVGLPATVTLNLSNGTTKAVAVTWTCSSYDGTKTASYTFTGAYTLPTGITGTMPAVTANVIVGVNPDLADQAAANVAVTALQTAAAKDLTVAANLTGAEALEKTATDAVALVDDATVKTNLTNSITIAEKVVTNARIAFDAVATATNAVVIAEASHTLTDLNVAKGLVIDLPVGVTKTSLQARIDAIVTMPQITNVKYLSNDPAGPTVAKNGDIISLIFETNEPITKLSNFKINGSNPDTFTEIGTNSYMATHVVDDGDIDGQATFQINVKNAAGIYSQTIENTTDGSSVTIVTDTLLATAAVVKAETSKLQDDVVAAKALVDALPDGVATKVDLQARLAVITAPVINVVSFVSNNPADNTKATIGDTITLTFTSDQVVTKLGNFKINGSNPDTFTNVGNVYTATHKVDAGDANGVATYQINVQNAAGIYSQTVEPAVGDSSVTIDKDPITTATNAVVKAETSKLSADVVAAQALVNFLPADVAPDTTKANLQARLAAVTVTIATDAVVNAEASKLQADVIAAKALVNALPNDVATKSDLQARLAAITAPVISNVSFKTVTNVDGDGSAATAVSGDTIVLTFTSDQLVTKLGSFKINGSNPDTFTHVGNVYTATHIVDAGDVRGTVATFQINVQNAAGIYSQTVEATTDGSSVIIDEAVKIATDAVVKAETSKLQADVVTAKALVDALPNDVAPDTTKAGLQARLAAITAPVISNVSFVSNNADPTKATIGDTLTLTFTSDEAVTKLSNFKINGSNPDTFTNVGNVYTATHVVDAGDVDGTATFQINVKNAAGIYSQTVEATKDGSSVTIDKAVKAATDAVALAETSKLQADVITAKALVDALPNDVAPDTTKADLQARLAAVTAPVISNVSYKTVTNVDGDGLTSTAVIGDTIVLTFTSDQAVTKLGNFKINGSNPDTFTHVGNVYTATHIVDAGDVQGTAASFQINVQNAAGVYSQTVEATTDGSYVFINVDKAVKAATDAVVIAETSKLQADVVTAKALVNALPAGIVPAATIADLQARLAAVTAPVISNVSFVSSNADKTIAKIGDTLTLTFTSDEDVTKLGNFKINGSNPDMFTNVGNVYIATHKVDAGDVIGTATFQINVKNAAGVYSQTVENTTDKSSVRIVTDLILATEAVVKAETSRLQVDVVAAKTLVDALPVDVAPDTTKADLQARLAVITMPVISNISFKSATNVDGDGLATTATIGDTITLTFTSDEVVTKLSNFKIDGSNPDTFTQVGNLYFVTHKVDAGDVAGTATFQINVQNAAGIYSQTVEATTDGSIITIH